MKAADRKIRNEMVIRMFQELGSTRLVADQTGIPWKTVSHILKTHGISTPREGRVHNPYSACRVNRDLVLRMDAEGHSLSEIAEAIGTVRKEVKKFLRQNGVTREFPKTKTGEKHYKWKGRTIDKDGYVLVHVKGHPNARKHSHWVLEHRLVMEQMLGRVLLPGEVVHHRDKNKQNNHPSNLQLFASNGEHLAEELCGQCPKWSEEGYARICEVNRQHAQKKRKTNHSPPEDSAPECI